jgi:Cof subfamily protein (haloacid dehalogenase superfamily)
MLRPEKHLLEKLGRIRLVVMDIDGTLVSPGEPDFRNVVNHLKKLKALGISFSIATGRTFAGASSAFHRLLEIGMKPQPMIVYNGAVVLSGSEPSVMVRHVIDRDAVLTVVRKCRHLGYSPLAYACTPSLDLLPHEAVYTEGKRGATPEFNGMSVRPVADLLQVDDEFVALLVEAEDPIEGRRLTAELATTFGDIVRVTTSGGKYIEVSPPAGTKSRALRELATLRRLQVDQVMAIGDNFNDLEMIAAAGVGVAVKNAPAEVREVAMLKCTLPAGQGVVEALRVLTRSRRSRILTPSN